MESFETLLEQAQRLKSTEREEFLERVCKGDTSLRKRLENKLELLAKADKFFDEDETSSGDSVIERAISEAPGAVIGRYKLREKIGEGGCGFVYVADKEKPVRRLVALKLIKLGMDTRTVIARFE